jgi:hypothetical protein
VVEHVLDLFSEVGHGELEEIEVSWEMERVHYFLIVLYVEAVSHHFDNGSLVLIDIAIVRGAKYCDDAWQLLRFLPVVNFVTLYLHLVRPNN